MSPDNGARAEALKHFRGMVALNDAARLLQRGRDPQTARFTIERQDGSLIHVGTIDKLMSRAQFNRVLAVSVGRFAPPCKPADWQDAIGAMIMFGTDVEETPGEALSERALDWLEQYLSGAATSDQDGAAARREPFRRDGEVWIHADHFARWLRREYSEQVAVSDIRLALGDLGFRAARVDYTVEGRGAGRKRTTARYFAGSSAILEEERDA